MDTNQMLIEKLKIFGLAPLECRIYLFLINREPKTAVGISQGLNVPRTSIYDGLARLVEKGLVERVVLYKSQKFRAHPLETLSHLLDQHKAQLEKMASSLSFLEENISAATNFLAPSTQVRYFHGASGIRQMMWNALSAQKENIGYSVMSRKDVVGPAFLKRFLEELGRRGLTDRVLVNPNPGTLQYIKSGNLGVYGKMIAPNEKIRIIPDKTIKITGDTTIYNNVFAVMYWRQGEVVGAEIENPELIAMQKSIFETLWKLGKPIKPSHL